nr:MAG: capsid protein [Virus sp.]
MQAAVGGIALGLYANYRYDRRFRNRVRRNFLNTPYALAALNAYESMPPIRYQVNAHRQNRARDHIHNINRQIHNSMSVGGSYESTSAGRLGPCRQGVSNATSAYSKQGFVREITVGGALQDNTCIYLGHSDLSTDSTLYQTCVALVRSFFKASGFDFQSVDDKIPPFTDGMNSLMIDWLDNSNTVQQQGFPWNDTTAPFNATPASVALALFDFFKAAISTNARRIYRRIFGYSTGGNTRVRSTFNLASARISILNTSSLKVQNSSKSSYTPDGVYAGDIADESNDNINAVPLKGVSYFGKKTWTGLRPYQLLANDNTAATGRATVPLEILANPEDGFMTLRGPNSANWIATPLVYSNPPPPAHMMNVKNSGYVTLEPGCMKNDNLVFKFEGSLNTLLAHIVDAGQYSMSNATLYSRSSLGHFKLFAFEKKLHSTADPIVLRYEINKILRAKCYLPKESMSLVRSDVKGVRNYLPPPPPA